MLAEGVQNKVIDLLKKYNKTDEAIDREWEELRKIKLELKNIYVFESFTNAVTLGNFKQLLRKATGKEEAWLAGTALKHEERDTPNKVELWKEREKIRNTINEQSRKIIHDVFGTKIPKKDEEDLEAERARLQPVNASTSSSSTSADPQGHRPKRSRGSTKEKGTSKSSSTSAKSAKKKSKRNPYDGHLVISEFVSVSSLISKNPQLVNKLQTLMNETADIIDELASKDKEFYIDGESKANTRVRCYCAKPSIFTNVKFRKQKKAIAPSTAPAATEDPAPEV